MKTFFKLILVVLLIAIIGFGIVGYNSFKVPSTVEMVDFFSTHRGGLEQKKVAMLSALEQKQVISLGADTQLGYRWLEIEPQPDSYLPGEPVTIRYYTHLRGIGVGGFGTGIAYIDSAKSEKIYPSIEAMSEAAKQVEGFIGYSRIVDNWYCFLWEAD